MKTAESSSWCDSPEPMEASSLTCYTFLQIQPMNEMCLLIIDTKLNSLCKFTLWVFFSIYQELIDSFTNILSICFKTLYVMFHGVHAENITLCNESFLIDKEKKLFTQEYDTYVFINNCIIHISMFVLVFEIKHS